MSEQAPKEKNIQVRIEWLKSHGRSLQLAMCFPIFPSLGITDTASDAYAVRAVSIARLRCIGRGKKHGCGW